MKNILHLFFALCLLTPFASFGQISMTSVVEKKIIVPVYYDSMRNFLRQDYSQYVGQELYLVPKHEDLRKYGYDGFVKDINLDPYNKKNIYKCCDGYNSKYDELEGQYFVVDEAISSPNPFSSHAFLKLTVKETGENVFYKYSIEYEHSFPFLVVGFYEKQKKVFVNNKVLIRPYPKIDGGSPNDIYDIATGNRIELIQEDYLTCLDITIDTKHFRPSFLLKTDSGERFLFPLYSRFQNIVRIFTEEEVKNYIQRFGLANWNVILQEKVVIGFTEEMTMISWGAPDKINKSSDGDQWVYDGQYLYFENDNLTSFN